MRTTSGISQQETFNLHSSVERSNFRLFVSFLFYFNIGDSQLALLFIRFIVFLWLLYTTATDSALIWRLMRLEALGLFLLSVVLDPLQSLRVVGDPWAKWKTKKGSRYLAVKCSKVQDESKFLKHTTCPET
jgi:hypothetical protein